MTCLLYFRKQTLSFQNTIKAKNDREHFWDYPVQVSILKSIDWGFKCKTCEGGELMRTFLTIGAITVGRGGVG